MNHVLTAWLFITLLIGGMAVMTIWARRRTLFRGLALLAFLLAAPFTALALASSLGWAIPIIPLITAEPDSTTRILGAKMIVGEAIYVLADVGPGEPRYYRLPWNQKMADAIQEMLDNPDNAGVEMTVPPFEWSWDQHPPQFHPLPQPKVLPDKPPRAPAPHYDADREA